MAREATLAAPVARPRLSRRARELLTGYLYLLPVAIALGGTVLFPILKAIQMSLYNHVLIKPQEYGFVGPGQLRASSPRRRLLAEPLELLLVGLRLGVLPVPGRIRAPPFSSTRPFAVAPSCAP